MSISIRACTAMVVLCCIVFMTHQRREIQYPWIMVTLSLLLIVTIVWVALEHE